MRAYSDATEEALQAREWLKDWRDEGLLPAEQFQRLAPETACEFRRTNIFLRLVLFLFTLIIVGAAVGLFLVFFVSSRDDQTVGVVFMFLAAISYAGAEIAISQVKLYRYGIEEALAACSVGLLCVGMQMAFFGGLFSSPARGPMGVLVPAAGAVFSLWIWFRIGLPYAFLSAMLFTVWLPGHWTSLPWAQHVTVALLYCAGLVSVVWLRPLDRFTVLDFKCSIAEALLWLGIYLSINLQILPADLLGRWWSSYPATTQYPRPFYWTTWVLTWCLPPLVLARGLRRKDRFVIAAGTIAAILTLITNKPYLGWQRHTWDPMLLGALLAGVAVLVRRWLSSAQDGVRHGFTAERLSAKDKRWMNAGVSAVGLVTPNFGTQSSHPSQPEARFGGGDSGGGGATSNF